MSSDLPRSYLRRSVEMYYHLVHDHGVPDCLYTIGIPPEHLHAKAHEREGTPVHYSWIAADHEPREVRR